MSYLDDQNYTSDQGFAVDQLSALTPADILRGMNMKTFGVPNPPLDANPTTLAQSNSMKYWKRNNFILHAKQTDAMEQVVESRQSNQNHWSRQFDQKSEEESGIQTR